MFAVKCQKVVRGKVISFLYDYVKLNTNLEVMISEITLIGVSLIMGYNKFLYQNSC